VAAGSRRPWTWHLSASSQLLGKSICFLSHFRYLSHHTPLSLSKNTSVIVVLWVGVMSSSSWMLPSHRVVPSLNVQGKSSKSHVYHIVSVLYQLCFATSYQSLYHVSCRWWGNHYGPPSTNLFLSTPTHHPGGRFRNLFSALEPACLNGRSLRFRQSVHIIGCWSEDSIEYSTSVHLFILIGLHWCALGIIDIIGGFPRTC
jgi:hypothetical protein